MATSTQHLTIQRRGCERCAEWAAYMRDWSRQ